MRKEFQLLIAVGGIYFCYFQVGLIQEYLFKNNFGTQDQPSPKFEFSSILILLQMTLYCLLCKFMVYKNGVKFVCSSKEGFYLGSLNFISMMGALTALQFVSFPLQALTKSCKILSVLIVGLMLGHKQFTKKQIACGFLITIGIYAFNYAEKAKGSINSSIFGILLLLASLFADGTLATLQSKLKGKKIGQWEMGYHISQWGMIGALVYTLVQNRYINFYDFILTYPTVLQDVSLSTLFSVSGQVFIFYCIKCFSPRVLSIVTTTRKFFTVLLSIFIHNHELQTLQWFGIIVVAFGVSWELFMGMSSSIPAEEKNKKKNQEENNKQAYTLLTNDNTSNDENTKLEISLDELESQKQQQSQLTIQVENK